MAVDRKKVYEDHKQAQEDIFKVDQFDGPTPGEGLPVVPKFTGLHKNKKISLDMND